MGTAVPAQSDRHWRRAGLADMGIDRPRMGRKDSGVDHRIAGADNVEIKRDRGNRQHVVLGDAGDGAADLTGLAIAIFVLRQRATD